MSRTNCVAVILVTLFVWFTPAGAQNQPIDFKSPQLRLALEKYRKESASVAEKFNTRVERARLQAKQAMESQMKKLTKAGKIDEAMLARKAVTRLENNVLDCPLLPDDAQLAKAVKNKSASFTQQYIKASEQFQREMKPIREAMVSQLTQAEPEYKKAGDLDELIKIRTCKKNIENMFLTGFTPNLWRGVMEEIQLVQHVSKGYWQWTVDGLLGHNGLVLVPLEIQGDYELSVLFTRKKAKQTNAIEIQLPVGNTRRVNFVLDGYRDKHLTGFSRIRGPRGNMVPNNGTGIHYEIATDQPHVIQIKVRVANENAEIDVQLDNQPLVKWSGAIADIEIEEQPCLRLGAGFQTAVTYNRALLRMLKGRAVLVPCSAKRAKGAKVKKRTGLGISFKACKEGVLVKGVLRSSSAMQAGIRSGDIITSIDTNPTTGISESDVVELISGPAGTSVQFKIKTADGKVKSCRIKRGVWGVQIIPPRKNKGR